MKGPPEITEIRMEGTTYIIRTEPAGLMDSPWSVLSRWALLFNSAIRLVRGDRTWTIAVREWSEDPFGLVLHQEVAPSRDAAATRLEALEREIRAGRAPWQRSP